MGQLTTHIWLDLWPPFSYHIEKDSGRLSRGNSCAVWGWPSVNWGQSGLRKASGK